MIWFTIRNVKQTNPLTWDSRKRNICLSGIDFEGTKMLYFYQFA